MGPKKQTVSSGKKIKRARPSSTYDEYRFVSEEAEKRYEEWYRKKQFIPERRINLEMPEHSPIMRTIRQRGWENLVSFAKKSPSSLTKEFCANADPDRIDHDRTSWVRGRIVDFSEVAL